LGQADVTKVGQAPVPLQFAGEVSVETSQLVERQLTCVVG
jgi:hypothetical protein